MGRLLILLLLGVVIAWWLLGRAARIRGGESPRGDKASSPGKAGKPDTVLPAQDMVRCAHCGIHLPRSEALSDGADLYCSDSHRLLGRQP